MCYAEFFGCEGHLNSVRFLKMKSLLSVSKHRVDLSLRASISENLHVVVLFVINNVVRWRCIFDIFSVHQMKMCSELLLGDHKIVAF